MNPSKRKYLRFLLNHAGTFVIVEASRPAELNDRAVMTSPNLPGCYRCLKFWVHMLGEKFGSLNIHFSTNTSTITTKDVPALNVGGSHGNRWKYLQVDVDVTNVFRVRIRSANTRIKMSQLVNKICSHCLFPVVDKSGTSWYHLVTNKSGTSWYHLVTVSSCNKVDEANRLATSCSKKSDIVCT